MVYNVQSLRAIAAMMVVHAHAASAAGLGLRWRGGAVGVDLFFVISGFIISYVADIDASQFVTRRLIRIVPIYWASTLAVYLLVSIAPVMFRTTSSDVGLLIRSLLFLPDSSSIHKDGILHPTLSGGWTLNYEMYFYLVFWLSLLISRRRAGLIASAAMLVVVIVVHVSPLRDSRVAEYYGSPIVCEFMYGVLVFEIVKRIGHGAAWPRWTISCLAVAIATGLAALAFNQELFGEGERAVLSGIPALVVVLASVLLEKRQGLAITNRTMLSIGDASYALYLLHAYIVFGAIRLLIGKRTFSEPAGQLVTLGLIVLSATAAVALFRYFEKPLLRILKRWFVHS